MDVVCPSCRGELQAEAAGLVCGACRKAYPITEGIPVFLDTDEQCFWSSFTLAEYGEELQEGSERFLRYVGEWGTLLDLGGGDGVYSAPVARVVRDLWCVDPSLAALQKVTKRKIPNLHPVSAAGESLPFQDDFFDGVFLLFVIEHLADATPLLGEIYRVLRPQGNLIIATANKYNYWAYRGIRSYLSRGRIKRRDPTEVHIYSLNELEETLARNNFTLVWEDLRLPFDKPMPKGKLARYIFYLIVATIIIGCKPNKI